MSDNNNASSGGIGLGGLFFLVLFVLKVTGPLADVSWWLITAPLWAGLVLLLVFGLVAVLLVRRG